METSGTLFDPGAAILQISDKEKTHDVFEEETLNTRGEDGSSGESQAYFSENKDSSSSYAKRSRSIG